MKLSIVIDQMVELQLQIENLQDNYMFIPMVVQNLILEYFFLVETEKREQLGL